MNGRNALIALLLAGCTLAPPMPDLPQSTGNAPGVDPATAPLRITVFTDFGCASCARIMQDLRTLAPAYEGKVLLVPRDYITEGINPGAYQAAIGARCAEEQGKRDAFSARAFSYTGDWFQLPPEQIGLWAKEAELDPARFEACRAQPEIRAAIAADVSDAKLLRVRGTPTIYIGSAEVPDPGSLEGWRLQLDALLQITTRGAGQPSSAPSSTNDAPASTMQPTDQPTSP